MGAYHGKTSFETFSHFKSVMETGTPQFILNDREPPNNINPKKAAMLEKFMLH
jgi:hypothetical protein